MGEQRRKGVRKGEEQFHLLGEMRHTINNMGVINEAMKRLRF